MKEIEILNYAQLNFIQNGLYMLTFAVLIFITFRLVRFQTDLLSQSLPSVACLAASCSTRSSTIRLHSEG